MPDPPPAPKLTALSVDAAKAGTPLTLTGENFGVAQGESKVHFRLPDPGAPRVPAAISAWAATTIGAMVPALTKFGTGGPLEVTVTVAGVESNAQTFVLCEDEPPAMTSVVNAQGLGQDRGLEGDEVVIVGTHFGRQSTKSNVVFTAPGPHLVTAELLGWQPTSIRARVPSLDSLGGAGNRPVVVRTACEDSEPRDFLLGELPKISELNPQNPKPRGRLVIEGRAFGDQPRVPLALTLTSVFDEDDPGAEPYTTEPQIVHWAKERIEVTLPDLAGLGTTGRKDVVVRTEWGPSKPRQALVESRASITSWTRLEPHARTDDLQEGLRLGVQARVDDALWMLGRQWQMFEFQGEDAGSPVVVSVEGDCAALSRWRAGDHTSPLPEGAPLEAVVERERVLPPLEPSPAPLEDLWLSAKLGLQFLRHLDARLRDPTRSDKYRKRFLAEYGIAVPEGQRVDADTRRFMGVAERRAPDGSRLYADFQSVLGPDPQLPQKPPIDGNDRKDVIDAVRDWYAWCTTLFSERPADQPSAWDPERMEYRFATAAGDHVLEVDEHTGEHIDWYSFTRRSDGGPPAPGEEPKPFKRLALASLVTYPGMPAARWWEMENENARVDFGAVSVAASELLTLLFVEFALAWGNDWFSVPIDGMRPGSLCRLSSVVVKDTFGRDTELSPFGNGAGSDWRMFELTEAGTEDAGDTLLIPDALPTTLTSRPVEEVLLVRDELANLAWAVERMVEGRSGRPLDRQQDEQDRAREAELESGGPTPPAAEGPLRYLLQQLPPRNWYPLFPRSAEDQEGEPLSRLARGAMRDPVTGELFPLEGQLLEPGRELDLYDEEVPRSGARVVREWELGRAPNGETHLWRARRKGPGRGEGSSGLRYDQAKP